MRSKLLALLTISCITACQPDAAPGDAPGAAPATVADTAKTAPAATAPPIGFIGVWERAIPGLMAASQRAGARVEVLTEERAKEATPAQLAALPVIFVLNLPAGEVASLVERLSAAKAINPKLHVISLDRRDSQDALRNAGVLEEPEEIRRYWRFSGSVNMERMLRYTHVTFMDQPGEVLPPQLVPEDGLYHPDSTDLFPDETAYWSWLARTRPKLADAPRVVMVAHQSFVILGDTAIIDAMIRSFEAKGVAMGVIFVSHEERGRELIERSEPALLMTQRHSALGRFGDGEAFLPARLDVPYLKPVSMLGSTVSQWEQNPKGLEPRDINLQVILQEADGVIEPIVVGGLKMLEAGYRVSEAIPERIERLTERSIAWLRLKQKPAAERKVAIFYYNKYMSKADVGRGSPSGAYLNGPRSLIKTLNAMGEAGYVLKDVPADEDALLERMIKQGRNIPHWAHDELEAMVNAGTTALIPEATYRAWFEAAVPKPERDAVIANFGPPPGTMMVVEREGQRFIVVPRLELGNVVLLPQPVRGDEEDDELLHSRTMPPSHAYIATYLWLQRELHADAVVHFGTHGSLELLPTKAAGLSSHDWGDILLGYLPNIYPWILDNLAEATLARRRAYSVLVDHLVPPIAEAGMSDDLKSLHDDLHKFEDLDGGLLRETYRKSLTKQVRALNMMADISPSFEGDALDDEGMARLAEHMHKLHNEQIPLGLHTLSVPPEHTTSYITSILGKKLLEALARDPAIKLPRHVAASPGERKTWLRARAEALLKAVLEDDKTPAEALGKPPSEELEKQIAFAREMKAKLEDTTREIPQILRALNGGFIHPGPGNDPVRNPGALPTGRNLYGVNPDEIPTPQAWDAAGVLVEQLLAKSQTERGRPPNKVAIDLEGFETMRHYGVTEAMVFRLLGVTPIWDEHRVVSDVKLIPRAQLGRPRIDVFIATSGAYRDNFPTRMELIDRAIRMASDADEADNLVRLGTATQAELLRKRGVSAENTEALAAARIFGQAPGEYGTHILHLIPRSGVWDTREEVVNVYREHMSHVFTKDRWGVKEDKLYEDAMQGSETVVRTWASNMMSPLTNHHVHEYLGGLSMAIEAVTGKAPEALVADVRTEDVEIKTLEAVLRSELQVRLLNDKWLREMMQEGYAGGGQMSELVKNTFGWEVTRPESIDDTSWSRIHKVFVQDEKGMDIPEWFDKENPHAGMEIEATLLEAARKGMWAATEEEIDTTAVAYAEDVAEHGPPTGMVGGANAQLDDLVRKHLTAPGREALKARYEAAMKTVGKPGARPTATRGQADNAPVQGQQMKQQAQPDKAAAGEQKESEGTAQPWLIALIAAAALLLLGAAARRWRMG